MESIEKLLNFLKSAKSVGVLTGAGVSAESGIPTFRGKDGLWNRFNPAELATFKAFLEDPKLVWKWYLWRMHLIAKARPNPGHYALARMEELVPDFLLITQNVDGLHRRAGSKKVVELHGNIFEGKCRFCDKRYSEDEFSALWPFADRAFLSAIGEETLKGNVFDEIDKGNLPRCLNCGEIVGPGVVWFGEGLSQRDLERAFGFAGASSVFFSVGTSAVVQPAASIPLVAKRKGAVLVEVNPEETPLSPYCDFVFRGSSSLVLPQIVSFLEGS